MQFRCYTCGHKFSDGPPPMEALTDLQHSLVTSTPRDDLEGMDFRLLLLDTTFAGLTPHNFCTDCLLAIIDEPQAFTEEHLALHVLDQDGKAIWCKCGTTFYTYPHAGLNPITGRFPRISPVDWTEINRLKMRHISDSYTTES